MLVQMGIGALRPFDSISGVALGFSSFDVGLVASGHFIGFLGGCLIGPKLVYRAGHSRAFAIFAAVGVISIIAHTIHIFGHLRAYLAGLQLPGATRLLRVGFKPKPQTKSGRGSSPFTGLLILLVRFLQTA